MPRFNFTNITLSSTADITTVMSNFTKVENTAAILDDLPKTKSITIASANWVSVQNGAYYTYTISDNLIKTEPYHIDILFNDLTLITDPIYPKANSQANGKIILVTHVKPLIDLTARLVVTKGVAS